MTGPWISASAATKIVSIETLGKRLQAGLVQSRATTFACEGIQKRNFMVPEKFWNYMGCESFQQDWNAGDFSVFDSEGSRLQAFGVEMELGGILDILPAERRGEVARAYSVISNPAWISADGAIRLIAQEAPRPVRAARARIVEAARQGLVAAKAVEARAAKKGYHGWSWQEREWPIPTWYWAQFTNPGAGTCNFDSGTFRGRGRSPMGCPYVELSGVHFLIQDVEAIAVVFAGSTKETARPDGSMTVSGGSQGAMNDRALPPVSEQALQDWWARKAAVRDCLSDDELWALAKVAFAANFISRDRIRALAGPRKRGPKPIGGKLAAE